MNDTNHQVAAGDKGGGQIATMSIPATPVPAPAQHASMNRGDSLTNTSDVNASSAATSNTTDHGGRFFPQLHYDQQQYPILNNLCQQRTEANHNDDQKITGRFPAGEQAVQTSSGIQHHQQKEQQHHYHEQQMGQGAEQQHHQQPIVSAPNGGGREQEQGLYPSSWSSALQPPPPAEETRACDHDFGGGIFHQSPVLHSYQHQHGGNTEQHHGDPKQRGGRVYNTNNGCITSSSLNSPNDTINTASSPSNDTSAAGLILPTRTNITAINHTTPLIHLQQQSKQQHYDTASHLHYHDHPTTDQKQEVSFFNGQHVPGKESNTNSSSNSTNTTNYQQQELEQNSASSSSGLKAVSSDPLNLRAIQQQCNGQHQQIDAGVEQGTNSSLRPYFGYTEANVPIHNHHDCIDGSHKRPRTTTRMINFHQHDTVVTEPSPRLPGITNASNFYQQQYQPLASRTTRDDLLLSSLHTRRNIFSSNQQQQGGEMHEKKPQSPQGHSSSSLPSSSSLSLLGGGGASSSADPPLTLSPDPLKISSSATTMNANSAPSLRLASHPRHGTNSNAMLTRAVPVSTPQFQYYQNHYTNFANPIYTAKLPPADSFSHSNATPQYCNPSYSISNTDARQPISSSLLSLYQQKQFLLQQQQQHNQQNNQHNQQRNQQQLQKQQQLQQRLQLQKLTAARANLIAERDRKLVRDFKIQDEIRKKPFTSLGIDEDIHRLSGFLCFLRKECIEVFDAQPADVYVRRRSKKVQLDQVGIRCRFCAHLSPGERVGRSSSFPSSLNRIYQSVTMMIREHFSQCREMLPEVRAKYIILRDMTKKGNVLESKSYWVESASTLGMYDTDEGCIRMKKKGEDGEATESISNTNANTDDSCDTGDKVDVCDEKENGEDDTTAADTTTIIGESES